MTLTEMKIVNVIIDTTYVKREREGSRHIQMQNTER